MTGAMNIATNFGGSSSKIYSSHSTSSKTTGKYSPTQLDFIHSFYAVLRRWQSETAFVSDPEAITSHPSFRALVENAKNVTPLIIEELRNHPSALVWVLDDAFGEMHYHKNDIGDIRAMANGWIAWAERNGCTLQGTFSSTD